MRKSRIEAILRSVPPDEPRYELGIAARLARRVPTTPDDEAPFEVVPFVADHRHRSAYLAASVAVTVVVVIGLLTLARPTSTPTVDTLPTTSTASPTATSTLYDRWIAEPSALASGGAAIVEIDADQVLLLHTGDDHNPTAFGSTVDLDGEQLVLTLISTDRGCQKGAVGHYRFTLSSDGARLTLTALDDECAARTVISGSYTHTACPRVADDCLGTVPAGAYATVSFDPFGTHTYGQLRYTLPDGWSVTADSTAHLQLRPVDERAGMRIDVWADPVVTSCADAAERSTAIVAGSAVDVLTVDGKTACPAGVLVASPTAATPWSAAIQRGQRMLVFLVDLEGGHRAAITVVDDATHFESDVAIAETLIASFVFAAGSS